MTFAPRAPWPAYADFLALPLAARVRLVRDNLGLTLDGFAEAVGAKGRHAVMPWERGREPRDYADRIAALTPYPAEAFRRHADGAVSLATIDLRLRVVEATVQELPTADDLGKAVAALQAAIDRLASSGSREARPGRPSAR